jgi:hypothetical protein
VCYCVVPKYAGVVIMYAPLTVGSSPCLCSSVVYRSVVVDLSTEMSVLPWTVYEEETRSSIT